jgi:hypothetical protein
MNRGAIQTGIWLIGLGILFLTGRFWPEILIVIGLSMLATALIPKSKLRRSDKSSSKEALEQQSKAPFEEFDEEENALPPALGSEYAPPSNQFDASDLPPECPMCGGPVLADQQELVWIGRSKALCPYCATPLPVPDNQIKKKQVEK